MIGPLLALQVRNHVYMPVRDRGCLSIRDDPERCFTFESDHGVAKYGHAICSVACVSRTFAFLLPDVAKALLVY